MTDAERISELLRQLAEADQSLRGWNRELNAYLQQLLASGESGKAALQAMMDRQREQVDRGEEPEADTEVRDLLLELCDLFIVCNDAERVEIRGVLGDLRYARGRLYGLIHRAARQLRETRDERLLDRGLAAAAIEGGRTDFRDLFVALGELWLAAEAVGIRPAKRFAAAAKMAGTERDSFGRSGQSLLANFGKSAHLRSIKQRR